VSVRARRALGIALGAALTAALVLVTYLPTPGDTWVRYDNESRIRQSPLVRVFRAPEADRSGLLVQILTGANEDQYQPLHTLSLAVDHALFGWDPRGFYAHALALHLAAALLLFGLARRLVDDTWATSLAAAFASVHPITVEGVSWLIHRNLLVSVLFTLLGMLAYLAFLDRLPRRRWLWASTALFTLANLGKVNPAVVLLPFALDYWRRRAFSVPSALEKLPLVAITAALTLVNLSITSAQSVGVFVRPWSEVLGEMPAALMLNAANSIAPARLSLFYTAGSMLDWVGWRWIAVLAVCAALAWFAIRAQRRGERGPMVALWLWIPLVSQGLLAARYREVATADRYAHLAWMILCVGFALLATAPADARRLSRLAHRALPVLLLVPLVAMGRAQARKWSDEEQLWKDVVAVAPHPTAHGALGNVYCHRGEVQACVGAYRDAVALLDAFPGTRDDPTYHAGLARTALIAAAAAELADEERRDLLREAAQVAGQALERWPTVALFAVQLGHARLGLAVAGVGSHADAATAFARAAELSPSDPAPRLGEATALLHGGQDDQGRRVLEGLFDGGGGEVQARILLADFELSRGRAVDAARHYLAAAILEPRSGSAHAGVEAALRGAEAGGDALRVLDDYAQAFPDRAEALRAALGAPPREPR
jgi:tetratricopeptide (TPR) repeat protein